MLLNVKHQIIFGIALSIIEQSKAECDYGMYKDQWSGNCLECADCRTNGEDVKRSYETECMQLQCPRYCGHDFATDLNLLAMPKMQCTDDPVPTTSSTTTSITTNSSILTTNVPTNIPTDAPTAVPSKPDTGSSNLAYPIGSVCIILVIVAILFSICCFRHKKRLYRRLCNVKRAVKTFMITPNKWELKLCDRIDKHLPVWLKVHKSDTNEEIFCEEWKEMDKAMTVTLPEGGGSFSARLEGYREETEVLNITVPGNPCTCSIKIDYSQDSLYQQLCSKLNNLPQIVTKIAQQLELQPSYIISLEREQKPFDALLQIYITECEEPNVSHIVMALTKEKMNEIEETIVNDLLSYKPCDMCKCIKEHNTIYQAQPEGVSQNNVNLVV